MNEEQTALLTVASSPHEKTKKHVNHLMFDVLIALAPAFLFSVAWFGVPALLVGLVSMGGAVLFEFLFEKICRRPVTVFDGSALVSGLLVAMNVPASLPLPMVLLGDLFAMVVVKGLFGGLGKNIVNPALAARAFLLASFPQQMTAAVTPAPLFSFMPDAVSGATPLSLLRAGEGGEISLSSLLFGTHGGMLGEVSAVLLLIGGAYLLARRVISWHIPVAYLGTVTVFALLFPRVGGAPLFSAAAELLSGGLMLGAFFMATDYATSPVTPRGRLLFGAICGAITVFIRYFGSYTEGVSYAILIANLLVFYLDRFTRPRPFGERRANRGK